MTETKSPGTIGVLVLHVGAQSLNSALGTKMLLFLRTVDFALSCMTNLFFLIKWLLIKFPSHPLPWSTGCKVPLVRGKLEKCWLHTGFDFYS